MVIQAIAMTSLHRHAAICLRYKVDVAILDADGICDAARYRWHVPDEQLRAAGPLARAGGLLLRRDLAPDLHLLGQSHLLSKQVNDRARGVLHFAWSLQLTARERGQDYS